MSAVTINTNGQTLIFYSSSSAVYGSQANADAASSALTLPATISTATTYYYPDATAASTTLVIKTNDGTTVFNQAVTVGGSTGPRTLNPQPDPLQTAADAQHVTNTLRSGHYYIAAGQAAPTTAQTGNSLTRVGPVFIPNDITIAKIGCETTVNGEAGSVFRIGIWNDTGGGYPGTLAKDFGTVAGDGGAAIKEITPDPVLTLTRGLYWFGGAAQVAATTQPTMRVTSSWNPPLLMSFGTSVHSAGAVTSGYYDTQAGAFTTFTTTAAAISYIPRITFKTG